MSKNLRLAVGISALFCVGCGSGQSFSSDSGSSQYTGSNLEGGAVSQVSIDDSNRASITVSDMSASAEYVIAVYAYNTQGSTKAFQLGQASQLSSVASLNSITSSSLVKNTTEDFHQMLRELEGTLDPDAALSNNSSKFKAAVKGLSTGSSRDFKVLSSFSGGSSYNTITATLRYQTSHFNFYVDARDAASLSDAEIMAMADHFDNYIDPERGLFGIESDVDGDGKFNILLTEEVNKLGGSSGGIITGFFYAVDLFNASRYVQSNETEVFYSFVPDPNGTVGTAISKSFAISNILPSVMPHEYQHMINFNEHYFVNGGSPELSFLNEGLSHLAEDIYSINSDGYMEETGVENPARVSGYLANIDNLCIVCGSSLYQRGGSYLMLRYLYEQAELGNLTGASDGNDLTNKLLNTSNTGVTNIVNAVYGSTSSVEDYFRDLMGQFGLAVFLSGTGLSEDSRLNFTGINLRAAQNDNRGTVLRGPSVESADFPLTANVGGASISFVQVSGSEIQAMGGTLTLQLSSDAKAGVYVIQTGL